MITDIHIGFNNDYQDITDVSESSFANFSTLFFDDGTSRNALSTDTIQWGWYRIDEFNEKHFITGDFNMTLVANQNKLLSGYFRILLVATTPEGLQFSFCSVVKLLWNLSGENPPEAPKLFPNYTQAVSNNLSNQMLNAHFTMMGIGATPHYKSEHFRGGKIGDVDLNGVVNTSDLLLLLTKFGS